MEPEAPLSEPQHDTEEPKKGRSNAILTYETVANIEKGIVEANGRLDVLTEKVGGVTSSYVDHEARIRMLERDNHVRSGAANRGVWLYQAVWPAVMFLLAAFSLYLNQQP